MQRFLGLLAVLALAASALSQSSAVVWRAYKSGVTATATSADQRVIQNQGAFDTYWRDIAGDARAPRDVDFTKEYLVAVRLGQRPTGGYRVVIRSVERTKPNEVTVTYEERKPAPGSPVITMLTSPYDIVRVERISGVGNVVFVKRESTDTGGGGDPSRLRWRTYMADTLSGGRSEFARAIRSQQEWDEYWRVFSRSGRAPEDIDWNQEMAVAIHLGSRSSNGYDVLIDTIEPVQGGFVICYVEKAPSLDQKVRPDATSPFVIIRLPRLLEDITFRKRVWRSDG